MKINGAPITDRDLAYIRAHWATTSDADVGFMLGRTPGAVAHLRRKMGLHRPTAQGAGRLKSIEIASRAPDKPKGYTDAYVERMRAEATPAEMRLIEGMHREGVLLVADGYTLRSGARRCWATR